MSLLERLAKTRVLRFLLGSMAVLCATSASAATVWHPRCGYVVRAAAPRPPAPPRESAAPPPTFTLGRQADAQAIQVRVDHLLALPANAFHETATAAVVFRWAPADPAFEARPASSGAPRAPPRRSSSAVVL
jgi:hypothetical protein